jgi:DNA cross-link repair 1A protein
MVRNSTAKTPRSAKPKAWTPKAQGKPNSSILTFFKKVDPPETELFVPGRQSSQNESTTNPFDDEDGGDDDLWGSPVETKRRRLSGDVNGKTGSISKLPLQGCTPPLPEHGASKSSTDGIVQAQRKRKIKAPFLSDSDTDDEMNEAEDASSMRKVSTASSKNVLTPTTTEPSGNEIEEEIPPSSADFEGFENMEDFEDDDLEQDAEYLDKKFYERQRMLEQEQRDLEAAIEASNADRATLTDSGATCPICKTKIEGLTEHEVAVHVNACLDGSGAVIQTEVKVEEVAEQKPSRFIRPPKPAQKNPFAKSATTGGDSSAFTKIMANNAEDTAWKSAAAAEVSSRGKQSYERTCPFYKILNGFSICVDGFRYGAVEGCNAYFLSHFHSDHYIGLTSNWTHGPIFCSKVTANLVLQQLRVNPKYVVGLEFEEEVEVPDTGGARVTMIPANHCPGSSLFLFEKRMGQGKNPRVQRILHCGDFRACRAHVEHPLLRPEVMDAVTGKARQQKIDICYLDTTYLNPKYAFPTQEAVIQACADMCVHLNSDDTKANSIMEYGSTERANAKMKSYLTSKSGASTSTSTTTATSATAAAAAAAAAKPDKLLVVVGTYSIGKERICLGIARALSSKIYAPPAKRRICAALDDTELSALLTDDPRAAQVHMTPLFEIRADTLDAYLAQYGDRFARVVGFRPTGWNYRPPGSRFVEAPAVGTVLRGASWRSGFGAKDMVAQRGSTRRAACFGVPYSEHSSFRELTMFCCALRIDRVIPTVNVGSAKSREKMRLWVERWTQEKKKNGLFKVEDFE